MNADAQRIANEADEKARHARSLSEHPGFKAAVERLEGVYLGAIRVSAPEDIAGREGAYTMLRALDALRQDIDAAQAGGQITARNHRTVLNQ